MAMNPMQRRARNSFLTGMLVTLVVMAIVVVILLYRINQLNEDKEKLIALQQSVYVAAEDIKSGGEVTMESLTSEIVQTSMDLSNALTANSFTEFDDETGEEFMLEYVSKVDIPKGAIITMDMVSEVGDEVKNDQRVQEYNMIVLPSELKNGDFVDIRIRFASGVDYVVVAKKKILQCTSDTIWVKLSEDEILSLGCAIVDSYKSVGSKLYATTYVEAGLQEAATRTYSASSAVNQLIANDPNVLEDAKNALYERFNSLGQTQRVDNIDPQVLEDPNAVQSGVQSEVAATKSAREAFVEALEGSGQVGGSAAGLTPTN